MEEPIREEEAREVSLGPDPLSAALRRDLRERVECIIRTELLAAPGAERYERTPERRGYQHSPRERTLTDAVWSPDGRFFAIGGFDGHAEIWQVGGVRPVRTISTPSSVTALSFDRTGLLVASGTHVRLVDLTSGRTRTVGFRGAVVGAELDPTGGVFAVATRLGKGTSASILSASTGRTVSRAPRVLPRLGLRSFRMRIAFRSRARSTRGRSLA